MRLLERDPQLELLRGLFASAATGHGGMALLGGEAGAGKTVLMRSFIKAGGLVDRAMVGACDPLGTPRPLGPLLDIAPRLGPEFETAAAGGVVRADVFGMLLAALGSGREPDLVVFEDVHWADDATLDLLRFLGRRLVNRRALLVATFRDDDTTASHPLSVLFGDLATMPGVHRIDLTPLSTEAVGLLCVDTRWDPSELHQLTGGNPFFVTEVLRAGMGRVPSSVRDAVIARVERVSASGRAVLEAAAVIGGTVTFRLLGEVVGEEVNGVDDCIQAGLLRHDRESLAFRHELVRWAVEEATLPGRRASLHAAILKAVRRERVDRDQLPQLVRHAEVAGDSAAVLEFAPAAAEHAAEMLAHRESAVQYGVALRFASGTPASFRADLLERLAHQSNLCGNLPRALDARREAAVVWHGIGDQLKEGENLVWASRLSHLCGQPRDAERLGEDAVRILESLVAGPELAFAHNNAAWLRMLAGDLAGAAGLGRRAESLARRAGNADIALHARITIAASELQSGDESGRVRLESAFAAAKEAGLEEQAGRAIWNLALLSLWQRRYGLSDSYLEDGTAYCVDHDLESWRLLLLAARARWYLEQGRWAEAEDAALESMRHPDPAVLRRIMTLVVLGRLRARRGHSTGTQLLDEALRFAIERQWVGPFAPVQPARAEGLWLAGDSAGAATIALAGYDDAARIGDCWQVGELAFWAMRAGEPSPPTGAPAEPYALAIAGDWTGAAAAWRKLGCPYEMAQSLSLGEDETALREALTVFDSLGAVPAAAEVRRRLRDLGAVSIPRGPRPATRVSPAGLTARESEVLVLVASGLGNPAIAARLFLSEKTVEHHVSAMLRKLAAVSRADAVREARQLGILDQDRGREAPR